MHSHALPAARNKPAAARVGRAGGRIGRASGWAGERGGRRRRRAAAGRRGEPPHDLLPLLRRGGAAQLQRIQTEWTTHPQVWNQAAAGSAARSLGADVSGLPWSMEESGRRQIYFWQLEEHHRMWTMLAGLRSQISR